MRRKPGVPMSTFNVRAPLELIDKLTELAKREHRARSNLILVLILEALEARARRAEEA